MTDACTFGFAVPLTGSLGAIGTSVVHGAEVALAEHADSAPELELRIEDTGGEPERAATIVEEFVDDGVPLVGGPISSDVALGVREVAERREVPFLPAMGGNPAITEPGTRYTFRFSSSNRQSGLGTVAFFRSQDVDRIAIVGADFSYPRAVTDAISEFGAERGLSVDSVEFVPLGTDDFGPVLDRSNADAIGGLFLPYPGSEAVTLLRQIRSDGRFDGIPVVGDYSLGSAPYSRELDDEIVGTYNWGVDTESERAEALAERVSERFDESTGVYHHFGYDLVGIARAALARGGTRSPRTIRDALGEIEYDAVSGWGVSFDENGLNERYRMLVNEWTRDDEAIRNRVAFRSGSLDVGT